MQLATEQLQKVCHKQAEMLLLSCMAGCCLMLLPVLVLLPMLVLLPVLVLLMLLGKNSERRSNVYGVQAAPVLAAERC